MAGVISFVTDLIYFVTFIVLFYLSIKMCFWKGNRKKPALFFMSLFTNPVIIYFVVFIVFFVFYIGTDLITTSDEFGVQSKNPGILILCYTLLGITFLLLLCISSLIVI